MKLLHLDIETKPMVAYAWGLWKQNIAINQIVESGATICWAAMWDSDRKMKFDSVHKSSHKDMLKGIWNLLDEADAVVHYNGTKFDIPTLNLEFAKHDMLPPSPFHQVDLYSVVRNRFRSPSNKMDYISQEFKLGSKTKHMGMQLWTDCMAGDKKAWKLMEKYNRQDVLLLQKLYKKLLPWIKNHPNHALFSEDPRPMCPNCGSHHVVKRGKETTQVGIYQRYSCTSCGTPIRGRTSVISGKEYKEKRKGILTASKL